jgi:hypothetical protein
MSYGEWFNSGYESYYVRPVVEAFFYDSNKFFQTIIDNITGTGSEN